MSCIFVKMSFNDWLAYWRRQSRRSFGICSNKIASLLCVLRSAEFRFNYGSFTSLQSLTIYSRWLVLTHLFVCSPKMGSHTLNITCTQTMAKVLLDTKMPTMRYGYSYIACSWAKMWQSSIPLIFCIFFRNLTTLTKTGSQKLSIIICILIIRMYT